MSRVLDAIKSGDAGAARAIARAEPDLLTQRDDQGVIPAVQALYRGAEELAAELLPPEDMLTIFEAALFAKHDRAAQLVDSDPELVHAFSPDGFTALHLAIFSHSSDIARTLIDKGADIEAPARGTTAPGARPLQTAAFAGEFDLAKVLLEAGADPNAGEDAGANPYTTAQANGDDRMMKLLLDYGADAGVT